MENINEALKASIASDETLTLIKEYAEVGLDSLLKEGGLKDIPILSTVLGLYKIGASLKEQHFVKKLLVFMTRLSEVPAKDREQFVRKLSDSDEFKETVGEKVLLLIERLDETKKAEVVGNLFRLYAMDIISKETCFRLSAIVEQVPLYDLLAFYYTYSWFGRDRQGEHPYRINSDADAILLSHGLLQINLGSKPSNAARATGLMNSGLRETTLELKISALGQLLANLMIHDLANDDFKSYIEDMKSQP